MYKSNTVIDYTMNFDLIFDEKGVFTVDIKMELI